MYTSPLVAGDTVLLSDESPYYADDSYREAHAAMELINRSVTNEGLLKGMELVEVNPILDEHNRTAELAVELIASAFGKRIL